MRCLVFDDSTPIKLLPKFTCVACFPFSNKSKLLSVTDFKSSAARFHPVGWNNLEHF